MLIVILESIQNVGRGVKELVQAVQALRHLGVEEFVLPLPKIVVVGDQSSGKSSLIEGISEIKVPRSTGTCTRCPLEINLTTDPNKDWACGVSLCYKYAYVGSLGTSRPAGKTVSKKEGASRSQPLGPWMAQKDCEIHPFATLTSPSEVEDVLYLAQLAILNPSIPPEHFRYVPGMQKPEKTYQVKFSPNVIQLDIQGRDLPNLSFYDLPGVFNQAETNEETYLVDLVRNLVKEYIKQDDCINLLTLPMTVDAHNSSASQLIRGANAAKRTLGCLTKPDRLDQQESVEEWVQILDGTKFRLGHEYHVIKNNPDPLVDHRTARQEEAMFFRHTEPFATTLRHQKHRFGTRNLQTNLSRLLTKQIQQSLPKIIEKLQQKADSIDAELRLLPEPLSGNLPAIVVGEMMQFQQELEKELDGGSEQRPFRKRFRELAYNLRHALAETRPKAYLLTPHTHQHHNKPVYRQQSIQARSQIGTPTPIRRANADEVIDLDDEDEPQQATTEQDLAFRTPTSSRKRPNGSSQEERPCKTPRVSMENPYLSIQGNCSKTFNLEEVRSVLQNTHIGLPGQTHPKAIEQLIRESTSHWKLPVEAFIEEVDSLCKNMVSEVMKRIFGHRHVTQYYDRIMEGCESFLNEAINESAKMSRRTLGWELYEPDTLDGQTLATARRDATKYLQLHRRKALAAEVIDEESRRANKELSPEVRKDKIEKLPDNNLPPEDYASEMQALAVRILHRR